MYIMLNRVSGIPTQSCPLARFPRNQRRVPLLNVHIYLKILFPIFPPYSQWQPNRESSFFGNLQVSARLSRVTESCQPFISTWYAYLPVRQLDRSQLEPLEPSYAVQHLH